MQYFGPALSKLGIEKQLLFFESGRFTQVLQYFPFFSTCKVEYK